MELTDTSLILIALMPHKRDMEIARILGWYRIPLKSAPKILQVDYLAFYQTADFGEGHKSCIEKYAAVRGIELTTRAELFKDEPDHPRAHEEYYKIALGPIQSLPHPIAAGQWKRFLFFYTTGDKFFSAQTIRDLSVNSSERKILWHALRERAETGLPQQTSPDQEQKIPQQLLFLLGNLSLSGLDLQTNSENTPNPGDNPADKKI